MIPLPLDPSKTIMMSCCSKTVCQGCCHANNLRIDEGELQHTCPFCREPSPTSYEQCDKLIMKRIAANDPVAMLREGASQDEKGHYRSAFEYFTKAAELGDVEAHFRLVLLYNCGHGVEKDYGKLVHHLEEAAIGGHPGARYKLGDIERSNGRTERAMEHFIIGATQGNDYSIKLLMDMFRSGMVKKEDLAAALRAHQAAVDATKSPQREAAEEYYRNNPDCFYNK
jgi:TPR repeat protein